MNEQELFEYLKTNLSVDVNADRDSEAKGTRIFVSIFLKGIQICDSSCFVWDNQ